MERFDFSIAFQSFGGIRSTQPTMPQSVFLKLTPGASLKPKKPDDFQVYPET